MPGRVGRNINHPANRRHRHSREGGNPVFEGPVFNRRTRWVLDPRQRLQRFWDDEFGSFRVTPENAQHLSGGPCGTISRDPGQALRLSGVTISPAANSSLDTRPRGFESLFGHQLCRKTASHPRLR